MNPLLVRQLLVLLGSFWTRVFTSASLLRVLFKGVLGIHSQSEQGASELVRSASNLEVPAGRTTSWHKFVLSIYGQTPVQYGDPSSSYGVSYLYGMILDNRVSYDIDDDIISIPFLYDSVSTPGKVLTEGVDYRISKGKLMFLSPLSFSSDAVVLYARNMVRESGFTTSRLGYAINVHLSDRVYSKVPFKHLWRLHSYGPTYQDLLQMLGSCSRTPITYEDEVVEYCSTMQSIDFILTDKAAYAVPSSKSLGLQIGQVLPSGSPLASSLEVLHDKEVFLTDKIPAVYRSGKLFKYGNELAQGSAMVIIKADISGEQSTALKVLKATLPPEIKVLVLSNITVPSAVASPSVSMPCSVKPSIRTTPASLDQTLISVKAKAKVRYTSYGY